MSDQQYSNAAGHAGVGAGAGNITYLEEEDEEEEDEEEEQQGAGGAMKQQSAGRTVIKEKKKLKKKATCKVPTGVAAGPAAAVTKKKA